MKLLKKIRPSGDIDVTSFSDLAFLLIVFFVLTTTFLMPEGAKVTIPSSTSDPENKPEQDPPAINLSMDRMLFDQKEVTVDELRRRLAAMKLPDADESKRVIILDCAPDVSFERYLPVVTAVAGAGGVLALMEAPEGDQEAAK